MALNNYKNLLFDLGGVILDLKREDCVRAFEALGMENAESVFGEYSQTGAFLALEEGAISVDEFHAEVKKMLPQGVSDAQIDEAFGRFLVGVPMARLKALEELRNDYKVFLLSNTNPIHINGRNQMQKYLSTLFRTLELTLTRHFSCMIRKKILMQHRNLVSVWHW